MSSPFPVPENKPAPMGSVSSEDRTFAVIAHLVGLLSVGFLGPLVIWLIKKDSSPFVADQAKEALNFQLSALLACIICGVTVVGIILIPVVVIAVVVYSIIAAMEANKGVAYRYPYTFRFIS